MRSVQAPGESGSSATSIHALTRKRRTVERIFDFRARTIEELLGAQEPRPDASGVFAQNMRSEIAKTV